MPEKLEKELFDRAKKLKLDSEKANAYVYGTLRKTGWKPKQEKKDDEMKKKAIDSQQLIGAAKHMKKKVDSGGLKDKIVGTVQSTKSVFEEMDKEKKDNATMNKESMAFYLGQEFAKLAAPMKEIPAPAELPTSSYSDMPSPFTRWVKSLPDTVMDRAGVIGDKVKGLGSAAVDKGVGLAQDVGSSASALGRSAMNSGAANSSFAEQLATMSPDNQKALIGALAGLGIGGAVGGVTGAVASKKNKLRNSLLAALGGAGLGAGAGALANQYTPEILQQQADRINKRLETRKNQPMNPRIQG